MAVVNGDFLTVNSGLIVHGCNAVGGFGSGIAGQIAQKWPLIAEGYKRWFVQNPGRERELGDIQIFIGEGVADRLRNEIGTTGTEAYRRAQSFNPTVIRQLPQDLVVVNAITQFYYGRDKNFQYVDYDAVSAAFHKVAIFARLAGLEVHYPAIGAGLANGNWDIIQKRIDFALADIKSTHWVYK